MAGKDGEFPCVPLCHHQPCWWARLHPDTQELCSDCDVQTTHFQEVSSCGDRWRWVGRSRRCWHQPRGPAELQRKGTAPLGHEGSVVTWIEAQVGF